MIRRKKILVLAAVVILAAGCSREGQTPAPSGSAVGPLDQSAGQGGYATRLGDILIADQFNNRVIEATATGDIVWSYGLGIRPGSCGKVDV